MRRSFVAASVFLLVSTASVADLSYPALMEIAEQAPGRFQLTLTVPMVNGRYVKAKPVVPETFRLDSEPEVRPGSGSLTRTWEVSAEAASLPGSAFGLTGLLGTSREVRFVLSTLDGRRHETLLRSTQAFFVVPPPPSVADLAGTALHTGLHRSLRQPALWFLLLGFCAAAAPRWRWLGGLAACAAGIALGHLSLKTGVPAPSLAPLPALPATVGLVVLGASPGLRPGWGWGLFLGGCALAVGFLAGWTGALLLPGDGLSTRELTLTMSLVLSGWILGAAGIAAALGLGRSLLPTRWGDWALRILAVLAAAWGLYHGHALVRMYLPVWIDGLSRLWELGVHRWFSPFAADWAMARLRIPWLSLGALAAAIILARRGSSRHARALQAGGLIALSLVLLPWGPTSPRIPFMSPPVPSPEQAGRILEPMLSRIYHALNLEDESETYDRLAGDVTADLAVDLYLDSRRRLTAGTREGSTVRVRRVALLDIRLAPGSGAGDPTPVYSCQWSVTARVTHWQHSHERKNLYQGDISLAVEDDRWKLANLDLRSEEREVVEGSFSSR